jgi:hypothetical protein
MTEKLYYDLFAGGRWIGMAEGVDEDDAKRMAARCLPQLLGRFTLIRWHGRLHPDNCVSSGGKVPDPKPEPLPPRLADGLRSIADICADQLDNPKPQTPAEVAFRHINLKTSDLLTGV